MKPADLPRLRSERARLAEIAAEIAAARRRQRGRRGDPACTARRSTAPAPDLFAA